MKTTARDMQIETARLSEGMRLIFDQAAPSGSSSSSPRSRSSSSGRSSRSTSRAAHSSKRQRRRSLRRSSRSSSSSSGSSITSSGPSRSRSHPRCHRRSSPRHCCGRHCHSPPRHYRARSRSYSPSPDKSRRHGSRSRRYHRSSANRSYRARSRSYSRSSSSERRRHHQRSYRSRSRSERSSSSSRQHQGFVGRYRCRFPDSPRSRSPRSNRSRSRTSQSSSVHLSQDEKRELLKIAAENAAKTVGAERLVFPENVKRDLLSEESASERATPSPDRSTPVHSKLVSPEPESRQSPTQVGVNMCRELQHLFVCLLKYDCQNPKQKVINGPHSRMSLMVVSSS